MSDTGVDRDHEIEAGDQRRGLGQIGEMTSEVDDPGPFAQACLVCGPWVLLQTHKGGIEVEKPGQIPERDGTVAIVRVLWIAGPDQADAHPVMWPQPAFPDFPPHLL